MTALDQSSQTIRRLIDTCRETHDGFRSAAAAVEDASLKTLLSIYAQQRCRFAEELSGFSTVDASATRFQGSTAASQAVEESDLLRICLEREKSALALYRRALAERTLPTKAHFLVSAQLALLERVHKRILGLSPLSAEPSLRCAARATL